MALRGEGKGKSGRWLLLLTLCACTLLAGCAHGPSPRPRSGHPATTAPTGARKIAVGAALHEVGTAYRYGGDTPRGFDCSGLMEYALAKAGVALPRTARAQERSGTRIPFSRARAGDLLFYHFRSGDGDLHVGLYLGNGRMVHASSGARRVQVTRIDESYWWRHYLTAVRVLPRR